MNALGEAGHEILVAESGRSALSLLEHTTPDLVLLDFVMPGMDGIATCPRIKERPECREVPVLFMTAVDEPEQKVRAFAAGALDYITKPAYPPEVLARVAAHLQIRALQKNLADELALRVEAENALAHSLDRAVVLADATGKIVFSSRLAENLLHKYFPDRVASELPPRLAATEGLVVRRFAEPGRNDLHTLVLEERNTPPGPAAFMALGSLPVKPRCSTGSRRARAPRHRHDPRGQRPHGAQARGAHFSKTRPRNAPRRHARGPGDFADHTVAPRARSSASSTASLRPVILSGTKPLCGQPASARMRSEG